MQQRVFTRPSTIFLNIEKMLIFHKFGFGTGINTEILKNSVSVYAFRIGTVYRKNTDYPALLKSVTFGLG